MSHGKTTIQSPTNNHPSVLCTLNSHFCRSSTTTLCFLQASPSTESTDRESTHNQNTGYQTIVHIMLLSPAMARSALTNKFISAVRFLELFTTYTRTLKRVTPSTKVIFLSKLILPTISSGSNFRKIKPLP